MGWGLGFDRTLKPFLSGVASIYIDTNRMSAVIRNKLATAVRTMYFPTSGYNSQIGHLLKDANLHAELPSLMRGHRELYAILEDGAREELVASLKLAGLSVEADPDGISVYISVQGRKARVDHLDRYHDTMAVMCGKYVVPFLSPVEAERRQSILHAIETRGLIMTKRTF